MDELANKLQAEEELRRQKVSKPKISKEYPSLDFLLEDLRGIVSRNGWHNKALTVLKSKVSFDLTGEYINEILSVFDEVPETGLLRFLIVREKELGRTRNLLLDQLAATIIDEARRAVGYPTETGVTGEESVNSARILWWAKNPAGPLRDSERGFLEATNARLALISLLPDRDQSFFVPAVLRIFERCISQPKRKKARSSTQPDSTTGFARLAADQLTTLKPKSTLKTIVEASASFHEANENLVLELDRAKRRWRDASDELSELEIQVTQLQQSCESRETQIAELRAEIESAKSRIANQAESYEALDDYWKRQMRLQQNEMAFKIRSRLEHELNEIRLCLDRESPNTSMAMDRVAKIYKLLASLESV